MLAVQLTPPTIMTGWNEIKGTILATHFPGAMSLPRLAFSSMLHLGRPVGTGGSLRFPPQNL